MAGTDKARDEPVSIPWLILVVVCAPVGFNIVVALLPAIQAQFALDPSRMCGRRYDSALIQPE